MVVSCAVCGEEYGVTEDVTFHKFPANEERRKKWINAVQQGTWLPGKGSVLCSKHFSQDKFVYKISGEKVRRYLMPDTVPTIFDRTRRKSKYGSSRQSQTSNEASSSNSNASSNAGSELVRPGTDLRVANAAPNSTGNLNLEKLGERVGSEPYLFPGEPELNQVGKDAPNAIPGSVRTPDVTPMAIAGSSSNSLKDEAQNGGKILVPIPRATEKPYQTDIRSFPKRPRQVYPGDFKQLNYNDVTEVSRSWTILNNYVTKMRANMKVLRQRNRRLEKRVTDLKSVVKFLKNRIVTRDAAAVQLCGHSGLPDSMKASHKEASNHLVDHDYISENGKSAV